MSAPAFELSDGTLDVAIVRIDFDASVDFFVNKLGFPVAAGLEIPERPAVGSGLAPSGFRHLRVRAGDALIKLMQIDKPPPPPSDGFAAGVGGVLNPL